MTLVRPLVLAALASTSALTVAGCAAETGDAAPDPTAPVAGEVSAADEPDEDVAGPEVDTNAEPVLPAEADEDPFAADPRLEAEADAEIDSGFPGDSPEADGSRELEIEGADGGAVAPMPAKCKKRVTVIATVGVPGLSKYRTNGCWKVIITDGAAKPDEYRKCSTSDFVVHHKNAPSYAYDDTNPFHSLSSEKNFLADCARGARGVGWEFMAYRGGWRFLHAHHLRAYFAELYGGSARDIDSLWYVRGVYRGNPGIARRRHAFPMINFGTPRAAHLQRRIAAETLKICRTVRHRGYFGLYNASWREGMPIDDPRLRAVERGLNACTRR